MGLTILNIDGIEVKFNFEPYPTQRKYMEKVIKSVKERKNAILESPAGTGKTISLLCSTLAWIENQKANLPIESDFEIPKVIYATRTHQQIKQAMTELKNSPYCNVNAAVLGSRDQLCLHPNLQKISNDQKIDKCKSLRENKACDFYENFNDQIFDIISPCASYGHLPKQSNSILDIEDLHQIGSNKKCCPYFMSLERIEQADIIFMPYNYLFVSDIQKQIEFGKKLENAIIILDEAHNIPNVCNESTSASIDVFKALEEIENIDRRLCERSSPSNISKSHSAILIILRKFLGDLVNIDINFKNALDGGVLEPYLEPLDVNNILEKLDSLIQYFETDAREVNGSVRKADGLRGMKQFLNISLSTFKEHELNYINRSYKVYSRFEEGRKKLHFLCLSPSFGIDNLLNQNVRCLIMTSSSLAPLDTFIREFQFREPIEIREEFPHIIRPEQFFARSLSFGPPLPCSNLPIYDSKWANRDNKYYMYNVGISIKEFSERIPGGILVFFPTYAMIQNFIRFWIQTNLIQIKNELGFIGEKVIFFEPQNNQDLKGCLERYRSSIDDPKCKGAIFLAVARGKVSEGLNFTDAYGRGVIFIGFPLPPYSDPKVFLKRKYLDDRRNRLLGLSGDDWYNLEACKAVNQAIGRIIRHKNDYGAILLCDHRFQFNAHYLSQWVKSHLEEKPFYPVKFELGNFFENGYIKSLTKAQPLDNIFDKKILDSNNDTDEEGYADDGDDTADEDNNYESDDDTVAGISGVVTASGGSYIDASFADSAYGSGKTVQTFSNGSKRNFEA